jgi:hypothetical protein
MPPTTTKTERSPPESAGESENQSPTPRGSGEAGVSRRPIAIRAKFVGRTKVGLIGRR